MIQTKLVEYFLYIYIFVQVLYSKVPVYGYGMIAFFSVNTFFSIANHQNDLYSIKINRDFSCQIVCKRTKLVRKFFFFFHFFIYLEYIGRIGLILLEFSERLSNYSFLTLKSVHHIHKLK